MIISTKTIRNSYSSANITLQANPQGNVIQSHSYILFDVNGYPISFIGHFISGMDVGQETIG